MGTAVLASSADAAMTDKPPGAAKGIRMTRHNLSNWGLYAVKATNETQVCIFCHAPHNADSTEVPLWNHRDQAASVTFKMASTTNVSPGKRSWADSQPTGISKKCLSCHDGTVGIGRLANGTVIQVAGGLGTDVDGYNALGGNRTPGGGLTSGNYGYIGTDLRGGHVISFNYDQFQQNIDSGQVNYNSWNTIMTLDPKNIAMFDRNRKMQCHTCHDPHTDWCDDSGWTVGKDPLWRKGCDVTYGNGSVCRVCHKNMITFQRYSF